MDIIGLIKNALLALTAFLELKNKAFYYDILRSSKTRQKELINEIEALRTKTNNADSDYADLLRSELLAEKRNAEHLSAFYSITGKK